MKTIKVLHISILLLIAIIFNSCGTTHHFVPPRPLENNEYLISVNWHYNFDNSLINLIVPELSYYNGVDDNNIVGGGLLLPIFCSHISYANYNKISDNAYSNTFIHLNQFFGLNINPYFEVGISYASKEKIFWQMVSAGIAIGDGDRMPMLAYAGDGMPNNDDGSKFSFIPFVKYQLSGQNLGLSYIHYHGLTKASIKGILETIQHKNDTLVEIQNITIDKIEQLPDIPFHPFGVFGIFLQNGDTLILKSATRTYAPKSSDRTANNFLSQKGYTDFLIAIHNSTTKENLGMSTLKISDLIDAFNNGDDIILIRYSLEVLDEINKLNNFKIDHSIGVSIQTYKFRKDD